MEEAYSNPPWNFSWVVPKELAAMGWPQTAGNVRFLYEQGVRHLVTLSPEKRPPIQDKLFRGGIAWTEIGVEEFEAPSLDQIREFIELCRKARQRQEVSVQRISKKSLYENAMFNLLERCRFKKMNKNKRFRKNKFFQL